MFPIIGSPLGPGGYGNFPPLDLLLQLLSKWVHVTAIVIAIASVREIMSIIKSTKRGIQ